MKKLLSLFAFAFLATTLLNAQSFSIGARAGLNLAKETASGGSGSVSLNTRTSFLLGGYATILFNDNLGLQPELFYSSLGATSGSDVEKLNYISLPIFFRYNVNENVHFLLGPQISILMSAKDKVGGTTTDVKGNFNSTDLGIVPGVGVDFGKFNAGLRYALGLSNIAKNAPSGYSLKNNVFQIVVGYKIFSNK